MSEPASDEAAAAPGPRRTKHDLAKLIAAAVVVAAFIALAALALANQDPTYAARHLTPRTETATAPTTAPTTAPPTTAPQPAASALAAGAPSTPTTAAPTTPPPRVAVPAPAPPSPPPALPDPAPAPMPCELGLEPAPPGGGVASLVPLVPFFGPLSAEAFTMLPAFEPALPLFGPLLVAGGDALADADPALAALLPAVQALEQTGFDFLAPIYGPNRDAFLAAEAQFAAQMAPLVELLAASPGAGCLPALQALLLQTGAQ